MITSSTRAGIAVAFAGAAGRVESVQGGWGGAGVVQGWVCGAEE